MAFSNDSVVSDILEILGMKNIVLNTNIKRPIISNEFILKNNPDVIILGIQANNIDELLKLNPLLKIQMLIKIIKFIFIKILMFCLD